MKNIFSTFFDLPMIDTSDWAWAWLSLMIILPSFFFFRTYKFPKLNPTHLPPSPFPGPIVGLNVQKQASIRWIHEPMNGMNTNIACIRLGNILVIPVTSPKLTYYLPWLRRLDLDGHQRIVKEALWVFNKYHDPVIDERLQELRDGKEGWHDLKREPQDLLDVLILLKDDKGKPLLSTE
ncbi:hypothetical protein NE237_009104 [Protea cynaroides]|uniref:Cytochrome P450 n=1 Tax=Protea cynaroides TaxID=273540 RepID=A0A9Q0KXY2_9MAGN|nr:hypothetical protein NE237_009104 [Protea cynaroides]